MAGCLEKIIVAFSSKGVSAEFFLLSVCVRYLREGTCVDCGGEDVLQIIRAVFIKIAEVFCTMCSPDLKDLLEAVQARHPLDLGRIPKYACYPCGGDSFLRRSIFDHYHPTRHLPFRIPHQISVSSQSSSSSSSSAFHLREQRPLPQLRSAAAITIGSPSPKSFAVWTDRPTDRPTADSETGWGRRSRCARGALPDHVQLWIG